MRPVDVRPETRAWWLATMAVVVAFCALFARDATVLGLYMDAINPEYLAVRVLEPGAIGRTPAWVLPGVLLADRFPVLAGSYYHGPLQYYFALPFYAVLGTSIEAARAVQAVYGVVLLLGLVCVARSWRLRALPAGIAFALLAIDPAFNIAFKTQAYNVTWPLSLMLAAVALVGCWRGPGAPPRWQALVAGLLAGLAFYAYFVYLFFVPALAGIALWMLRSGGLPWRQAWGTVGLCAVGFCIGAAPYLLGYALVASASGGTEGMVAQHAARVARIAGSGNAFSLGLVEHAGRQTRMLFNVIGDDWVTRMVLRRDGYSPLGTVRVALLLCTPLALHAVLRATHRNAPVLAIALVLMASFLLGTLPFGSRIGGQHYAVLLPLLYLGAAGGFSALATDAAARVRRAGLVVGLACAAVLAGDALATHVRFGQEVRATGGALRFTDAINRFSADALRGPATESYFFPEWGLMMPFVFLTGGERHVQSGEATPARVAARACEGATVAYWEARDAKLAARGMLQARPALRADLRTYLRRDGEPALHLVRYTLTGGEGCAGQAVPHRRQTQGIQPWK